MKPQDAVMLITTAISAPTTSLQDMNRGHYALLFYDHDTRLVIAYDAADPFRCYNVVAQKHPRYEFLDMVTCPSVAVAREIIKHFSYVQKAMPMLLSKLSENKP